LCLQLFILEGNLPFLQSLGDKRPFACICVVAVCFGKRPDMDSSRETAIFLASEN
jgi:hypothetical protein